MKKNISVLFFVIMASISSVYSCQRVAQRAVRLLSPRSVLFKRRSGESVLKDRDIAQWQKEISALKNNNDALKKAIVRSRQETDALRNNQVEQNKKLKELEEARESLLNAAKNFSNFALMGNLCILGTGVVLMGKGALLVGRSCNSSYDHIKKKGLTEKTTQAILDQSFTTF